MIWKHIGYTMNEALGYGVPIVTTPQSVLKELPINDNMMLVCNWDMSNVDAIVKEIFERETKPFNYIPPEDGWKELLKEGKSTYWEEKEMRYIVKATNKYEMTNTSDNERSDEETIKNGKPVRYIPKEGEEWEVDIERKELLVNLGFVTVVKEIKEKEKIKENPQIKQKDKTTTRKTTKKSK